MDPKQQIKDYARNELGIDFIGFAPAAVPEADRKNLQAFLAAGYQGEMKYLEDQELRSSPGRLLPGVRSVIVIALNYYRDKAPVPADQGNISRYAWGRDYHKVFKKILRRLQQYLDQNWPGQNHRVCVDSAPLLEKVYAREAGLGFFGKNTLLINPDLGSFMLFGEILTTLELPPDAPRVTRATPTCGTCTRCLSACPTRALVAPGQIDARRCISYLTIESNSSLPSELGPALKNQVFGCDICQEVCPYNKQFAASSRPHPELASRPIAGEAVPLEELLKIKNSREFLERFAGSPLMRAKREGMIRNALNAAVNCCRETPALRQKFIPLIEEIARNDRQEKLRQLAARALQDLAAGVERAASKKVIS